jgi:hypothetical protein
MCRKDCYLFVSWFPHYYVVTNSISIKKYGDVVLSNAQTSIIIFVKICLLVNFYPANVEYMVSC